MEVKFRIGEIDDLLQSTYPVHKLNPWRSLRCLGTWSFARVSM